MYPPWEELVLDQEFRKLTRSIDGNETSLEQESEVCRNYEWPFG